MDILIYGGAAALIFGAGLLVGRKNPSVASAAAKLVAQGDSTLQAAVVAAKADLAKKI